MTADVCSANGRRSWKAFLSQFILHALLYACMVFSIHADAQMTTQSPQKLVLFVCTGNYYRSRFAEALFNEKAREAHLDWRAISRGLKPVPWQHGISPLARRELIKRGVPQQLFKGEPKALTQEDLEKSDSVVVMDEAEHRPMLEKQFPVRDERKIHYWHIADAGEMKYPKACEAMSRKIEELLRLPEHQGR
jgi:protein-tyrosine phosphatase